jgi:hypothetical protein
VVRERGDVYQTKQLTEVSATGGPVPPTKWTAVDLSAGCRRCTLTDESLAPHFNVGGTHITQVIRWRAANGDLLTGNFVGSRAFASPTPLFAIGHVNRFHATITFVKGTGQFAGVRGSVTGDDTTTVLAVDPAGTAHKSDVTVYRGRLTYR